jgi:hypothetical protein
MADSTGLDLDRGLCGDPRGANRPLADRPVLLGVLSHDVRTGQRSP